MQNFLLKIVQNLMLYYSAVKKFSDEFILKIEKKLIT